MKKFAFIIFIIFLSICVFTPAVLAENENPEGGEAQPEQLAQPEMAPDQQEPAPEQPAPPEEPPAAEPTPEAPEVTPEPAPAAEPTPETPAAAPEPAAPTAPELTAAPPESIAPAPQPEDYGTVDLVIYTYTANGEAGAGYKVYIDDTLQITNDDGKATFPNLTVEKHDLNITNKDGVTRSVVLYMSRGNSTKSTGVAQDGTCGLDIARGVNQAYLSIDYIPDEPLQIKVSENKPAPPSAAPSASQSAEAGLIKPNEDGEEQYQAKEIFAVFNDKDGKGIAKLQIEVKTDNEQNLSETTNSAGRLEFKNMSYGNSSWSILNSGYEDFSLKIRKGVQTGVIEGTGDKFTVSVSPRTKQVYLTFVQSGDRFVLEEASESGGGMSVMFVVLIIAVVAIGVIVTIVLVKKAANRKDNTDYRNAYRNRVNNERDDYKRTQTNYTNPQARARYTGGSNKLNAQPPKRQNNKDFDDRYRM